MRGDAADLLTVRDLVEEIRLSEPLRLSAWLQLCRFRVLQAGGAAHATQLELWSPAIKPLAPRVRQRP